MTVVFVNTEYVCCGTIYETWTSTSSNSTTSDTNTLRARLRFVLTLARFGVDSDVLPQRQGEVEANYHRDNDLTAMQDLDSVHVV